MRKYLQRNITGSLGAVSGTTLYKSLWQQLDSFESYMIQIVWTGTPVATVSLNVSGDFINDENTYQPLSSMAPVNYTTVGGSSQSTVGQTIIIYDNIKTSANWIGLQWLNSSGTGTIVSVNLVAKGSQT